MPEEKADEGGQVLCSFPLCGATADWLTDFFGETEYYCDKHKPMVPQAFLKRVDHETSRSDADERPLPWRQDIPMKTG